MIAALLAYLTIRVGLLFSMPLWLALLPILFILPQNRSRIFALALLGLGLDALSAHPMFLLTLMLPLLGMLVSFLERLFERNPILLGSLAGATTLVVLLLLVISRVASSSAVHIGHIAQLAFLPQTLLAIFLGSIAAAFFLHAEYARYSFDKLRYD